MKNKTCGQRWVSQPEFNRMIREGLITDDSTLAAYLLLLLQAGCAPGSAGLSRQK